MNYIHTYGNTKTPTNPGPLVAIVDMEYFAVEHNVHADVEVLPVPVFPAVILGQTLSFDQFTFRWVVKLDSV